MIFTIYQRSFNFIFSQSPRLDTILTAVSFLKTLKIIIYYNLSVLYYLLDKQVMPEQVVYLT